MPGFERVKPPPGYGLVGLSVREPPANLEAEQALLGALLANNRALERVSTYLLPEHFHDPINGTIYAEIMRRVEGGEVADVVSIRHSFEQSGRLDEVGGAAYLSQLLAAMVSVLNAGEYGRLIYDAWKRRQLIDHAQEMVARCFNQAEIGLNAAEIAEMHMEALSRLEESGGQRRAISTFDEALAEALAASQRAAECGGMVGITTGFRSIDDVLGGLEPGTLIIVGARPGMGKTALALQMLMRMLRPRRDDDGNPLPPLKGGMISLEMPKAQLARRCLATEARVHYEGVKRGFVWRRDDTASRVIEAKQRLATYHLRIDDTPGLRPGMIAQRARAMKRAMKGLDVLVIDHLHLIGRGDTASRHGDTQAISEATQAMKALSKELECPVILLSQLNRELEKREDKRPSMADLRQSGSIEQDADAVLFVHRPEYFMGDAEPERKAGERDAAYLERVDAWRAQRERVAGLAEIIIAKNREGAMNKTVELRWDGSRMAFVDPQYDPPGGDL